MQSCQDFQGHSPEEHRKNLLLPHVHHMQKPTRQAARGSISLDSQRGSHLLSPAKDIHERLSLTLKLLSSSKTLWSSEIRTPLSYWEYNTPAEFDSQENDVATNWPTKMQTRSSEVKLWVLKAWAFPSASCQEGYRDIWDKFNSHTQDRHVHANFSIKWIFLSLAPCQMMRDSENK